MNSGLTVCLKEVAHGVYITIRWCIINSFQLEICLTIRIFKDLEILSHQTIATEFIQQNLWDFGNAFIITAVGLQTHVWMNFIE